MAERAAQMIEALGGKANIREVEACITRLRLVLADPSKLDERAVKALGAMGVIKMGPNIQVVLGFQAERIEAQMKVLLQKLG